MGKPKLLQHSPANIVVLSAEPILYKCFVSKSMALELVEVEGFTYYANNNDESKFIYKEIFQDQSYNVVELPENAFVVDAGANIGLFSIWVKQKYPSCQILAFEPVPATFAILQKNLALHDITKSATAFQCGLGANEDTLRLTYYPLMPGSSTLYPEEKETLRKIAMEKFGPLEFDNMFDGSHDVLVPIKRLSSFLDEQSDLISIDLLKIDVEGAEVDVLRGLSDKHWQMTKNVVMEIFDVDGRLQEAERLLNSKGFRFKATVAKWSPRRAKLYMVTCQRKLEA